MPELKKESYLRRRFHCDCDVSPWWGRISFKVAAFGILPIALLVYLIRWFTGDPLLSSEVSFQQELLLPVQQMVSSTRVLDPFALAALGWVLVYAVGMAVLTIWWEWPIRFSRALIYSFGALLSAAYLGAFAKATILYGALFAGCLLLPVLLALLLLACLWAGAMILWAEYQLSRVAVGATHSA